MIHIRKWSRSLPLPEKVTLVVTLVTFAGLSFVCSFVLLAALGAPLGRLIGILGLWLVEAQAVVTGAVWIGCHLFELLLNGVTWPRRRAKRARVSQPPATVMGAVPALQRGP
jgi:hypothetical protein